MHQLEPRQYNDAADARPFVVQAVRHGAVLFVSVYLFHSDGLRAIRVVQQEELSQLPCVCDQQRVAGISANTSCARCCVSVRSFGLG